jgi:dTDP-glucose 4,6-dehydratase
MGYFSDRRVLVTGAAGFIGSHLTQRVAQDGAQVRALLRYDSQNRIGHLAELTESERGRVEIIRGDLKDPEAVAQAVAGCDTVFHLGALIAIPFSYQNPTDYVQTNTLGTLHVLNACRRHGVRRLVHTSTSEVYGTARRVPITLDHPRQAQSPYSASKIAADALAASYACSFDLPVVILRPFNTYGPRQSPRAVIPTIVRQALVGEMVRLGATHPTRDFLFVSDTVAGFLAAASADLAPGTELQIGTGIETGIADVVALVGRLLNRTLRITTEEKRLRPEASEVERLVCDFTVARATTGWEPRVSLADGLGQVIAWMRAHQSDTPTPEIHQYTV